MSKNEYIAYCESQGRRELLKMCRAGGLTAHKLKTDHELATLLWECFGKERFAAIDRVLAARTSTL